MLKSPPEEDSLQEKSSIGSSKHEITAEIPVETNSGDIIVKDVGILTTNIPRDTVLTSIAFDIPDSVTPTELKGLKELIKKYFSTKDRLKEHITEEKIRQRMQHWKNTRKCFFDGAHHQGNAAEEVKKKLHKMIDDFGFLVCEVHISPDCKRKLYEFDSTCQLDHVYDWLLCNASMEFALQQIPNDMFDDKLKFPERHRFKSVQNYLDRKIRFVVKSKSEFGLLTEESQKIDQYLKENGIYIDFVKFVKDLYGIGNLQVACSSCNAAKNGIRCDLQKKRYIIKLS